LLRIERLPHRLWEPACGRVAIVQPLRAAGHEVLASDLVDYGDPTHFYRCRADARASSPTHHSSWLSNSPRTHHAARADRKVNAGWRSLGTSGIAATQGRPSSTESRGSRRRDSPHQISPGSSLHANADRTAAAITQ
jgi:hypothetical protein